MTNRELELGRKRRYYHRNRVRIAQNRAKERLKQKGDPKYPINQRMTYYRNYAQKRRIKFEIPSVVLEGWQSVNCSLCADSIGSLYLIRRDHKEGFTIENVFPACFLCSLLFNRTQVTACRQAQVEVIRGFDRQVEKSYQPCSVLDFLDHIEKITKYQVIRVDKREK